MDSIIIIGIIYLGLIRVSLTIAGIVCVVLGYRLFNIGLSMESHTKDSKSSIDAKLGHFSLKYNNLAPGTAFAVFGATIIMMMMYTATPSIVFDFLKDGGLGKAELRGAQVDNRNQAPEHTLDENDLNNYFAKTTSKEALNMLALALNDSAWNMLKNEYQLELANKLSLLSIEISPNNANFHHTCAMVLYKSRHVPEAISELEKAHVIDAAYGGELETWRRELTEVRRQK